MDLIRAIEVYTFGLTCSAADRGIYDTRNAPVTTYEIERMV